MLRVDCSSHITTDGTHYGRKEDEVLHLSSVYTGETFTNNLATCSINLSVYWDIYIHFSLYFAPYLYFIHFLSTCLLLSLSTSGLVGGVYVMFFSSIPSVLRWLGWGPVKLWVQTAYSCDSRWMYLPHPLWLRLPSPHLTFMFVIWPPVIVHDFCSTIWPD